MARRHERGMTVRELIEALEEFDEDAEVFFSYDYGDHAHTIAAVDVTDVAEGFIKENDYVRGHSVVDEFEAQDIPDEVRKVIILE